MSNETRCMRVDCCRWDKDIEFNSCPYRSGYGNSDCPCFTTTPTTSLPTAELAELRDRASLIVDADMDQLDRIKELVKDVDVDDLFCSCTKLEEQEKELERLQGFEKLCDEADVIMKRQQEEIKELRADREMLPEFSDAFKGSLAGIEIELNVAKNTQHNVGTCHICGHVLDIGPHYCSGPTEPKEDGR